MLKELIIYTPMYVTFSWAIILLFSARNKNRPKFFLGIFMIAAFLLYLSHAYYFRQKNLNYVYFDPIYIFASLSVYPFYYWYIKLLTIECDFKWYNIRMFVPAAFFSVSSVILYVTMSADERNYYILFLLGENKNIFGYSNWVNIQYVLFTGERFVFTIQVLFFLIYGKRLVSKYNHEIANFYSDLENRSIIWVKLLLYSFFLTSVMSIIFNLIGRSTFTDSSAFLLIPSVVFSVLLFIIGFQGYMQNYTVSDFVSDQQSATETNHKSWNKIQLQKKLIELFEHEKIYKHPDLKIIHVSKKLNTNRTYISNTINSHFNSTFNDFVNKYRVNEAKELLINEIFNQYSLQYISEAVGFGSVSTFIREFKKFEGIPPGQYRSKFLQQ